MRLVHRRPRLAWVADGWRTLRAYGDPLVGVALGERVPTWQDPGGQHGLLDARSHSRQDALDSSATACHPRAVTALPTVSFGAQAATRITSGRMVGAPIIVGAYRARHGRLDDLKRAGSAARRSAERSSAGIARAGTAALVVQGLRAPLAQGERGA
jgi:hypothetical protein